MDQLQLYRRPKAVHDAAGHFAYIADGSPRSAERFVDDLKATFELLQLQPEAGGLFPTTSPKLKGIRAKPVRNFRRYVVFYRVSENRLEIIRILAGGQEMASVLLQEQLRDT